MDPSGATAFGVLLPAISLGLIFAYVLWQYTPGTPENRHFSRGKDIVASVDAGESTADVERLNVHLGRFERWRGMIATGTRRVGGLVVGTMVAAMLIVDHEFRIPNGYAATGVLLVLLVPPVLYAVNRAYEAAHGRILARVIKDTEAGTQHQPEARTFQSYLEIRWPLRPRRCDGLR